MTERLLMPAGAAIFAIHCTWPRGGLHLACTFLGARLEPRDPAAIAAMQATTLRLTRDTTAWRAWIGFNASHDPHGCGSAAGGRMPGAASLGALVFAAFVIGLAGWRLDVLRDTPGFAWLAVVNSLGWLVLAKEYWFRIPYFGVLVASACFLAAAVRLS